jgi:hypothetical protein
MLYYNYNIILASLLPYRTYVHSTSPPRLSLVLKNNCVSYGPIMGYWATTILVVPSRTTVLVF